MKLPRFIFYFVLFTSLLAATAYFIESGNPHNTVLIPKFWVIFTALALLTLLAYVFSWVGIIRGGEQSVLFMMGGIVIKLIFCMVLVLVYLLKFRVNDVQFAVNFISVYFLFTAFEIYCLLRNLRHQNKT